MSLNTKIKFWDCCQCRNVIEANEYVGCISEETLDKLCTNEDCRHPRCYSCHKLDFNLRRIYDRGNESDRDVSREHEGDQEEKSSNGNSANGSDMAESKHKRKPKDITEDQDASDEDTESSAGESVNDSHDDDFEGSSRTESRGSGRSSPNSSAHDTLSDGSVDSEDETLNGETFDFDEDVMAVYGEMLESLGLAGGFHMYLG